MRIVFDSKTGNVKRFVKKLDLDCIQVAEGLTVNEPFVLITYSTGFGQAPQSTLKFLENNGHMLQGVVSSGNMNWGELYGKAADRISEMYSVPVLMKFELSGTNKDVERFKQEVNEIVDATIKLDSA
ncbi:class Ib ribonucleoside-diphosphate reductase assembly flavoprotein NrdI [Paenibacillus apiarius]|uniref:Protein NrdI n=1 Tax=Paenibacillus apiarius TaxID=46240 RepID=A0ABT4DQN5_9BACL|nr:class Ib ribonucleoside-diphosphate reductase assembly flavoprotein NrdI [Paenibacillus apiarius]MCY9513361.1 class Ib ribonucleoside-diphosphate reductase assembly flavoprotein NrdI [Paenibacillus apiarius]MCY9519667.1 class Ib ribonucleoside-diphosphate reductase assembly flavoprotein NrdI [Paenibacillus apiarius]MCY9553277.1 class Ib ribonucleoside-diphosphate reductase assembly flavoprotein NrdI [Paenibacillus apiarius]MCY9557127.1 class Ib ribonucleoside-diphosphate reductase assembly f